MNRCGACGLKPSICLRLLDEIRKVASYLSDRSPVVKGLTQGTGIRGSGLTASDFESGLKYHTQLETPPLQKEITDLCVHQ